MKTLKIILLIVITSILFVLALPSFDLSVAGKKVKFTEIDLSNIGIGSNFPSLKEGSEIYPSTKYSAQIEFQETDSIQDKDRILNDILSKIQNRLNYANLYNISVQAIKNNDLYQIELTIPNTYPLSSMYASWILNNSELQTLRFTQDQSTESADSQPQIQAINIRDFQFRKIEKSRNIFIEIDTTQKRTVSIPHLVFTFDSPVANIYGGINPLTANDFGSGIATIQMYIGNQGYGLYAHESDAKAIRAIPTGNAELSKASDIDAFLSLTQSYFMEETTFERPLKISESTEFIKPIFNNDGIIFISLTYIVSILLIALYSLRTFGLKLSIALVTSLVSAILVSFNLLKILNASISTGFIVGFLVMTIFMSFILFDIIRNGVKYAELSNYSNFVLVPFISIMALSILEINLGLVNDIIPVVAVAMLGLLFAIQIYLRLLISILKLDK